ncbi:MAG: hypothetical protein ABII06_04725 [Pseudomonadota bacterium]
MADVRTHEDLDRIIVACLRTRPEEDFFSHYAATRIEKLEAELRQALAVKPEPGKTKKNLKYWRFRVEDEDGDVHYLEGIGFIGTDQEAAAECDRRVQLWEDYYGGNGIRAVYESIGPAGPPSAGLTGEGEG